MARRLLTKAVQRMRRQNLYAGTLSLGVTVQGATYEHQIKWRQEIRMHPACDPFTFMQNLDILWSDMLAFFEGSYHMPRPKFKKVSTILTGLREPEEITGDLFAARTPEDIKKLEKQEALSKALDKLQAKYQKETVTLGVPPKTLAGYVGTKIAFSRVPEQEEFWS